MAYVKELYFAYGSNLNLGQMAVRCPSAEPVQALFLKDWRLVFRSVADVEPAAGERVPGALWRVLPEDEQALDQYEGIRFGLYRKVFFRIAATGEEAFMYVMDGHKRGMVKEWVLPPAPYFAAIKDGYDDWGFDHGPLRQALITTAARAAVETRKTA